MTGYPSVAAALGSRVVSDVPLPGTGLSAVVVPPPGRGPGRWVGAPSAALDEDGGIVVAYRLRDVPAERAETVIARSQDGETFTTVAALDKSRFGAMSLERPALVRSDRDTWMLYVCCATPGSKHWWIDVLEAPDLESLGEAEARCAFAGDERTGVKDPVIRRRGERWEAWICCHPLDEPGEEDRMMTAYATSVDGVSWSWRGAALAGRPGKWDARGARVTAVLDGGAVTYDGRATKEENFFERTGLARRSGDGGRLVQAKEEPISHVRYLDVLALPSGGYRLYYEAPLPDESHELRTDLISPSELDLT
jgi:hypothetical protein